MTGTSPGVAVIGYGWMGRLHAQAYSKLRHHYPDLPAARLIAVADPETDRQADAIQRFGFERSVADWRELLDDPAVEAVSVTAQVLEAMAQSARTGRWTPVQAW
jgi:predicted dehydrogenase